MKYPKQVKDILVSNSSSKMASDDNDDWWKTEECGLDSRKIREDRTEPIAQVKNVSAANMFHPQIRYFLIRPLQPMN